MDVPEGAPLRTWTIRTAEVEPLLEAGMYAKWWPPVLRGKRQFRAHLLGFRGIGSALGNPLADKINARVHGKGVCPALVLRLDDGRKRCFTRGSFSDGDQQYIIRLYEKEMARLHAALEPPPTRLRSRAITQWPDGTIYTPGTFRTESAHFVVCAGSQNPVGKHSPWVDEKRKEETRLYREATMRHFEDFWAYNEYAGHLMPFWEKAERYKYTITVPGTMRDGFGEIPGFAGGGYGACGIRGVNWHALYHEWGHGAVHGGMILLGGGETLCDAHQTMADPTVTGKVGHQIDRPHKNLFHGQYPGGLGYAMMADDPNWGYAAVATLSSLMADNEHTPMHAIARLGQERGIWKNGIKGMGDMMGQIGARFADYEEKEAQFMAQVRNSETYRFYERWNKTVDDRINALGYSEEVGRLEKKLTALQTALDARKRELSAEFDARPENVRKQKLYNEWQAKYQNRFRELQQANAELAAAQARCSEARALKNKLEQNARKQLGDKLDALRKARNEAHKRRNAYIEARMRSSPAAVKNRSERLAVLEELKTVSPKKEPARLEKLRARERELNRAYGALRQLLTRGDARLRELDRDVHAVNGRERATIVEAASRDPEYKKSVAREKKAQVRVRKLDREIRKHPDLVALQAERNALSLHSARAIFTTKNTMEPAAKIKEQEAKTKKLRLETALSRNADEYYALTGLGWGRRQYGRAIERRLKTKVLPLMPEDRKQMREALPFQQGTWHTRVDWDGRTRWEKSGEKLSPIMQRWLKRTKPYRYP